MACETDERKDPQPTALHTEYVIASRQAATRSQRIWTGALAVGLVIAIGLAVFALIQRHQAEERAKIARSRQLAAEALLQQQTNPELSLALSVEAGRTAPTSDAATAIREALDTSYAKGILEGNTKALESASYSPDGRRIVTASDDGTARIWDARTQKALEVIKPGTRTVLSASYDPGRKRIVTTGPGGAAAVWDATTGRKLVSLRGHHGNVWDAAFSADGRLIATAGQDGTARLWNAWSGRAVSVFREQHGSIYSAAFSPDGKRVVTASHDGTATVWSTATGKIEQVLEVAAQAGTGTGDEVNGASFSPDGREVVTASDDGIGRVWNLRTGKVVLTLPASHDLMYTAYFSKRGGRVVTASLDAARVWDVAPALRAAKHKAVLVATLRGHTGDVVDAQFSPDGRDVVTGSKDHTARIWEAGRDDAIGTLRSHRPAVISVAFNPDGFPTRHLERVPLGEGLGYGLRQGIRGPS